MSIRNVQIDRERDHLLSHSSHAHSSLQVGHLLGSPCTVQKYQVTNLADPTSNSQVHRCDTSLSARLVPLHTHDTRKHSHNERIANQRMVASAAVHHHHQVRHHDCLVSLKARFLLKTDVRYKTVANKSEKM
jgi:hypothetical protein